MVIQRIFGTSITSRSVHAKPSPTRLAIEHIRRSLLETLHDCKDMRAQRIIYQINVAKTPTELWMLRSDLHQCIAQAHTQQLAAERINALIPVFEGWLPAAQLSRI